MILLERVSKSYSNSRVAVNNTAAGSKPALQETTTKIAPGEFVFVTGRSGVGKTTLLKLLAAIETPTTGEIVVSGRNLKTITENNLVALRREVSFIFQDYNLINSYTVEKNIELPLQIRGITKEERKRQVETVLYAVSLHDKKQLFPVELSGGEQQRVAIARALVCSPKVIIADEPTGNLDTQMRDVIFDLLLDANRQGVTVIVATHDDEVVKKLGKRVVRLG